MTVFKGWEGTVKIENVTVARATGLTIEVSQGLEPVYVIGRREPYIIKEGSRSFTGTIDKMFLDDTLFSRLYLDKDTQDEIWISGVVSDGVTTRTIIARGVKFDTWSWELPQDDFVVESVDFTATGVTYE